MAKRWSNSTRVYWGGYDVGTATTSASVGLQVVGLDPTVIGDEAERVLAGLRQDAFTWSGLFDDATAMDAAGVALIGSGTNNVASVLIGTTSGDRAYSGTVVQLSLQDPISVAELVRQEAEFKPDQGFDVCISYGEASTLVGSGSGSLGTLDNSASSTNGGTFYLHVIEVLSGTIAPEIEHSADDISFPQLGTFGVFTAGGASRKLTTSGTVRRYTRIVNNGTGEGIIAVTQKRG